MHGGATKAMGAVLRFQCETFNDVRRFRSSIPCSEWKEAQEQLKAENAGFILLKMY